MVMHARKQPRLNDGYYDRPDYHEKDDRYGMRSYDRKPYERRDRDDYGEPLVERQPSPRYSRKLPYIGRIRPDSTRYETKCYSRDSDRLQDDRKGMLQGKARVDSKTQSALSDSPRNRDRKRQDSKSESSQKSNKDKNEVQKQPLRTCGDWSEHLSSSGKKYYYHCKTEISQWVKPKEWNLENPPKDNKKGSHRPSSRNGLSHTSSSESSVNSPHGRSTDHRALDSKRDYIHYSRTQHLIEDNVSRSQENINQRHSASDSPSESRLAETHQNGVCQEDTSDNDMDISPDTSPRPASRADQESAKDHKSSAKSVPDARQSSSDGPGTTGTSSVIWGEVALQTLQTLQEVLSRSVNPNSTESQNGFASPTLQDTSVDDSATDSQSERPEQIELRLEKEDSPAASEGSKASLPPTELVYQPIHLPAVLANYYDPSLVQHISSWPAEQLETRAQAANNEGVMFGHVCGLVSAELKRDRSSVRVAEIQSTLLEHRSLFLQRQIADLESSNRNYTSGDT